MKSNFYFLEHTIFFPFIFIFLFIFIAFFNLLDVLNFQKSTSCFIFVFFSTVPIAMYLIFLILEKNLISFSGRGVLGTFAFILSFYFILQDDCIFYFFENSEKNYSFNEFLLLYLKFFTHIFNSGLIVICSIASIILLPEIIVSLLFDLLSNIV